MGGIRRLERSVEKHLGVKKRRKSDPRARRVRGSRQREAAALRGDFGLGLALETLAALAKRVPFYRRTKG